ncbi:MAG: hypothetical protein COA78_19465 [Blastopirellula sp.]|nr:MAG: hypothetical protein COA78_19465 [Blastopirellula sp.]
MWPKHLSVAVVSLVLFSCQIAAADETEAPLFQAGAFAVDISPTEFPVIVNGGMYERTASQIRDRLHARCIVLDDGQTRLAIVVVDSCMIPRKLLDEAKELAKKATGIPPNRILISATHTHSAPSVMGCLGSSADERYSKFLPVQIAKGIQQASKNLQPARIGWASAENHESVFIRRYLMKPGTARTNRFSGKQNDQAQMNPGHGNPNKIKRTGTVDPEVSVVSIQTRDGKPIALLGNYSTHYAGSAALSADYFAVFANEMERLIGAENQTPAFVGIMSNGTSGDTNCLDFEKDSKRKFDALSIGKNVAQTGFAAYNKIQYFDWVPLVMAETKLELNVRMPSAEEVTEAKEYLKQFNGRKPRGLEEVYARETVLISEQPPTRELKLQALRIGDLGIATIPNEVYSETGLAIKKESPLKSTFTIELANGAEGYIPPPEQHKLGGYTTWRARSSLLEEQAEPKIRKTVIELLNKVQQANVPRSIKAGKKVSRNSADLLHSLSEYKNRPFVASPVSPEESLKYLQIAKGYKIELVAAEPLIEDPVAFDWSEDGRLWVVEMTDYPLGVDGNGKPGGRIKVLEDTNQDGKYDKATVFASGLSFPNGILCWKDGILVTCAPDILFLPDRDENDKADSIEKIYSGFTEGNPQLRINGLRWGLDNWVYCANGISSVDPIQSSQSDQKIAIRGRDLRIDPRTGKFEALTGRAQFGRNRDDFGNWFGCSNAKPMWHYVLEDRYISRNPFLKVSQSINDVSVTPAPGAIFPIGRRGIFFHESQVGHHTSANSAMVYRDSLLFGNQSFCFTSEPVNNLIHRERIMRKGSTFTSQRIDEESNQEFLASFDNWFRPNMMRTGPDGALWIADIYREVIDHPQYVPKDRWSELDFRAGEGLGRIYRVVPIGKELRTIPDMTNLSPIQVAKLMTSPNGIVRDRAQRHLVLNNLQQASKTLRALSQSGLLPQTQIQSLWTLQGLGTLKISDVVTALSDKHPEVQRNAIQLSEFYPQEFQLFSPSFNELTQNSDESVRLQLALSLGEHDSSNTSSLIALLSRTSGDSHFQDALLSSLTTENIDQVTQEFFQKETESQPHQFGATLLAMAIRMGKIETAAKHLPLYLRESDLEVWQLTALTQISAALSEKKLTMTDLIRKSEDATQVQQQWETMRTQLSKKVIDIKQSDSLRIAAISVLGITSKGDAELTTLLSEELLTSSQSFAVQQAAIQSLSSIAGDRVPELLFANWKSHTPQLRQEIITVLLSRKSWTTQLISDLESSDNVRAADIDTTSRQLLLRNRDSNLQKKAAAIFESVKDVDRALVIQNYQTALEQTGSVELGRKTFIERCSSCHQLEGQGIQVGPDLKGLTTTTPESFLTSILDPNRSIDARYLGYNLLTVSGITFSGILADESGSSLTLLTQNGKKQVVPRHEIEEIQSTGISLMPQGFEKDITITQMRDLLSYLEDQLH